MPAPFEHIVYEVSAGVAHVVLNRPDKLNAIGVQTREEIARRGYTGQAAYFTNNFL